MFYFIHNSNSSFWRWVFPVSQLHCYIWCCKLNQMDRYQCFKKHKLTVRMKTVSGGGQLKTGGDVSDIAVDIDTAGAGVSDSGSNKTRCIFFFNANHLFLILIFLSRLCLFSFSY